MWSSISESGLLLFSRASRLPEAKEGRQNLSIFTVEPPAPKCLTWKHWTLRNLSYNLAQNLFCLCKPNTSLRPFLKKNKINHNLVSISRTSFTWFLTWPAVYFFFAIGSHLRTLLCSSGKWNYFLNVVPAYRKDFLTRCCFQVTPS